MGLKTLNRLQQLITMPGAVERLVPMAASGAESSGLEEVEPINHPNASRDWYSSW